MTTRTAQTLLLTAALSMVAMAHSAPAASSDRNIGDRNIIVAQNPPPAPEPNDAEHRKKPGPGGPPPGGQPPHPGAQPPQPPRPTVQQPPPPPPPGQPMQRPAQVPPPMQQHPVTQGQSLPQPQPGQMQRLPGGPPPATAQQPGQMHPTVQQSLPPAGQQLGQQPHVPGQPPPSTAQQPLPPAGQQLGQPRLPGPPPAAAVQQAPLLPAGQPQQLGHGPFVAPVQNAHRLDDLRGQRHEVQEGNRTIIQEPGRMIVREGGHEMIRHDEGDRFRFIWGEPRVERRGDETISYVDRPDGSRIITVTDDDGRLLRRTRRGPDGREFVIIDNRYHGPGDFASYTIDLPPPVIRIPRERYIVDMEHARPDDILYALTAPPVDRIERRYTLDEIRYSPLLRDRMPRVDVDTVNFESGSWEVTPDQVGLLAPIADGIRNAVARNPGEVFLLEGYTDAVGLDEDNLSLSDRRAESVAVVLTQQFQVPAENLVTQGYGKQYLKIPTEGPERQNRRVAVRRITPLLTGQNTPGG